MEYSLDDGEPWLPMEVIDRINPPSTTYQSHEVFVSLQPTQAPERVQVRGNMSIETIACYNACNPIDSSNAGATLSIAEIWMVVERPEFKLYLDVDNNFDHNAPQSDLDSYVPGSTLDGISVPIQPEGTPLQTVKVIALYLKPNGKPAASPGSGAVDFRIPTTEVSKFKGFAMNAGVSTGADFQLAAQYVAFQQTGLPESISSVSTTAVSHMSLRRASPRTTRTCGYRKTPTGTGSAMPGGKSQQTARSSVSFRQRPG